MRKTAFFLIALVVSLSSCNQNNEDQRNIVPAPSRFHLLSKGDFKITESTRIIIQPNDAELRDIADSLSGFLSRVSGYNITVEPFTNETSLYNYILLSTFQADTILGDEGYKLQVDANGILIHAISKTGIFYGIQSLKQLLPVEVFNQKVDDINIKSVYITDKPRYRYRGMHLDVSRHFFPVSFVKRYIDLLSFYKMNTFHWHLTDDNGWRIEIKKYPDLTRKSAWHVDRNHQNWNEVTPAQPGEKATIGGYYTQDEIREVVQYAASRCVTIIPEIEMPGHSCEVFAAYPNLSCKGDTLAVVAGTYWPNIDILCAGNEDVFTFIDNVLTEVANLFPGPYIHIGGDEADKTRWKECPKCQKRIASEKLRDEAELQSWFIKRVEKMVTAKGKKMIGWDEILEGGLAPEATVMSWRGMEGGIEAAKMGHDVIMTPTSHCYFDYHQTDQDTGSLTIGSLLTLKKVYSLDPTPPVLNKMEAKHILGAQGNLWTEYIATPEHAEYMALPRMIALAEVVWSKPENLNYDDFIRRMQHQFAILDHMKVNYGKLSTHVQIDLNRNEATNKLLVSMTTELYKPEIHYTIDGSEPTANSPVYTKPFELNSSAIVKAAIIRDEKIVGTFSERSFAFHAATGAKVTLIPAPSFKYKGRGGISLTDAILGSANHNDGCWIGYEGDDAEITIDMGKSSVINQIGLGFIQNLKAWIMLPDSVTVETSDNNQKFTVATTQALAHQNPTDAVIRENQVILTEHTNCRYIRIKIKNGGPLPANHPYHGFKAWLFVDEVVVN